MLEKRDELDHALLGLLGHAMRLHKLALAGIEIVLDQERVLVDDRGRVFERIGRRDALELLCARRRHASREVNTLGDAMLGSHLWHGRPRDLLPILVCLGLSWLLAVICTAVLEDVRDESTHATPRVRPILFLWKLHQHVVVVLT